MRALLEKELSEALQRRGIRGRPWAIEIDDTVTDLLIEKGFSPQFGARPLKRAIETHLLTPLARAMMGAGTGRRSVPVRERAARDDRGAIRRPRRHRRRTRRRAGRRGRRRGDSLGSTAEQELRHLLWRGRFPPEAQRRLLERLALVGRDVQAVMVRKETALDRMSDPQFWESPTRFHVLAEAEYLDRLDEAFRTAAKLGADSKTSWPGTMRPAPDASPSSAVSSPCACTRSNPPLQVSNGTPRSRPSCACSSAG